MTVAIEQRLQYLAEDTVTTLVFPCTYRLVVCGKATMQLYCEECNVNPADADLRP